MKLAKIQTKKTWLYEYKSLREKSEHMKHMIAAQFIIEKEGELWIEFSQIIKT